MELFNKISKNSGQTLIEVVVALTVGSIIVTSVTVAVISALNNSEYARNLNYATYYSQQAMDIIKAFKNNNYTTFKTLSGPYCLASSCTSINNTSGDPCGPMSISCPQNVGNFIRAVTITQPPNALNCISGGDTNQTDIKITVSWSDNKCTNPSNVYCHSQTEETCISSFNIQPTP